MSMRKIQDADLSGKRLLMRVDFNVAIEDGKAKELFKITAGKESIQYALSQGAKVALISHLGRPEGKENPEFSLMQLKDDAQRLLGVAIRMVDDCVGEKVGLALEKMEAGEILLLENVRFHEGEEKNDLDFAQSLAGNFDLFVNEAFSVCHRDQASVTGVTKFLPSFAGFWLQKEVENLTKISQNPQHPAIAVIGGAKIETKLPLIKKFEATYDAVLVGGRIANEALDAKMDFSEKVILPVDFAADRADIGPETAAVFVEKIKTAQTVIWNGPMGKFEQPEFSAGTDAVLEAIIESGAFSVMGGGESVELLEEKKVMNKISFVSTGGGAMLEFLSGKELPGLKVLE